MIKPGSHQLSEVGSDSNMEPGGTTLGKIWMTIRIINMVIINQVVKYSFQTIYMRIMF